MFERRGCVIISFNGIQLYAVQIQTENLGADALQAVMFRERSSRAERQGRKMSEESTYYVVRQKAVPEVLLKVVEAKRLLETEKVDSVQDATNAVGISRSSFYKYKDDIFPFHDNALGTTITLTFQMDDEPGYLADVLKTVADYKANILTIHQSIPLNGMASLTLSVQILPSTGDISSMISRLEGQKGVHHVKILAKE